jgi:hypothetical protein
LAAKAIEDADPHSSVTYLNFACSGAGLRTGVLEPYSGMEAPEGYNDLSSQIDSVALAVANRRIDALFVTAGINDLEFSKLIELAGKHPFTALDVPFLDIPWKDEGEGIVNAAAESLLQSWPRFATWLKSMDIGETYILAHPYKILRNGAGKPEGCGALGLMAAGGKLGVTDEEINWMEDVAEQLLLAGPANWARVNQWNFVGGAQEEFSHHGYCATGESRYVVRFRESCITQGEREGMVHPNLRGHKALADRLVRAVHLGPTPRPYREILLQIESVLIKDELAEGNETSQPTRFQFGIDTRQPTTEVKRFDVPANVVYRPPADVATTKVLVWQEPTLPRLPTKGNLAFFGTLLESVAKLSRAAPSNDTSGDPGSDHPSDPPRKFGISRILDAGNQYGYSSQTQVARDQFFRGSVEVRYRISVRNALTDPWKPDGRDVDLPDGGVKR